MRNLLYVTGALVAAFSMILVLDAFSSGNLGDGGLATLKIVARMIGVLCGVVLFSAGAVVHAIERVEKVGLVSMPMRQQWQPQAGGGTPPG